MNNNMILLFLLIGAVTITLDVYLIYLMSLVLNSIHTLLQSNLLETKAKMEMNKFLRENIMAQFEDYTEETNSDISKDTESE